MCWVLPYVLDGRPAWLVAGGIAAWALYTIAAGGSLIEIETRAGDKDSPTSVLLR
jgi:hypothetical protein